MKLNLDCVRDVLLAIERCQQFELYTYEYDQEIHETVHNVYMNKSTLLNELPHQLQEDITYSVVILREAGYIMAEINENTPTIDDFSIFRLTYKGHEFLEEIRDGKVYSEVKKCLGTVGSFGLSLVSNVAQTLLGNGISAFLSTY